LALGTVKKANSDWQALLEAPAVGAAIIPSSYQLVPTRFALLKTT
jgi:hypothetical protein